MLDLSAYKVTVTSSSHSTVGDRRVSGTDEVIADGFVRCVGCRTVVDRRFVDFRMKCNRCADGCQRCSRELQSDGTCLHCVELKVATDIETDARRERGIADVLGNQVRPPLLTEDDEYNAYSGGVYEYNVNDDTIEVLRTFDRENEDARDLRALTNENGWCRRCYLELSLAERGRGFHRDCKEG